MLLYGRKIEYASYESYVHWIMNNFYFIIKGGLNNLTAFLSIWKYIYSPPSMFGRWNLLSIFDHSVDQSAEYITLWIMALVVNMLLLTNDL